MARSLASCPCSSLHPALPFPEQNTSRSPHDVHLFTKGRCSISLGRQPAEHTLDERVQKGLYWLVKRVRVNGISVRRVLNEDKHEQK